MQGQLGAWVGSLEFKRMQASAELEMIAYYRLMLQKERNNPAVHFSSVPSAALEVVGNELRFAPHHSRLLNTASSYAIHLYGRRGCSPVCRLGAFWYERTACAARLGCVELRRDASLEERRAGAALLRAFLHLMKGLEASHAELKAAVDEHAGQTSMPHMQSARPLSDAALFRAGVPHVLVNDGRCNPPQSVRVLF